MARTARCPTCGVDLPEDVVHRAGILHCRVESRGGPFYTFACPACGERLAAERDASLSLQVRTEADLEGSPRMLRALRSFLASPRKASKRTPSQRSVPSSREHSRASRPAPPRSPWGPVERRLLHQLGLPPNLEPAALKRRYRAFVRAEHPDRHAGKPLPERREREAAFVAANEIYRRLLAHLDL